MSIALILLAFDAHAGARDLTPNDDTVRAQPELGANHRLTAQLGVSGALDPKLRFTGGKRKGLTWQASVQAMPRPGDGLKLYPGFDAGEDSFLAMRVGGLVRHPIGESVTLEFGMAFEPISGFAMAAAGARTDNPLLGLLFGAPFGWFHTMESSAGLELAIAGPDAPVALWVGGVVSTAGMWVDGETLLDPRAERNPDAPVTDDELRQTLELLQPSIALTWRF